MSGTAIRTLKTLLRAVGSAVLAMLLLGASRNVPYIDHATIALLLLGTVVALGVYRGTLEAMVAALVGGAGYDFFYLPPFGFGVARTEDWLALGILRRASSIFWISGRVSCIFPRSPCASRA